MTHQLCACSSGVEHSADNARAGGSNPPGRTIFLMTVYNGVNMSMKKYILTLLFALIVGTPAFAQVGQTTDGTHATLAVGGMFTDHGNATATVDGELTTQNGRWQGVYDVNYNYQQSKSIATVNMGGLEAKRNYAIDSRNYAVADIRYDYNEFRSWQNTGVAAVGWGFKIFRNDHLKISNELTGGVRQTDQGTYTVARDSLWIRYTNGPITAYNKYLFEKSNIDYYRNQTGISYNLNNLVAIGVQNLYTRDIKENNITSMTLGFKF